MKYLKLFIFNFIFSGIFMAGIFAIFDHNDGKLFDFGIFMIRFIIFGLSMSAINVIVQKYTDSKATEK